LKSIVNKTHRPLRVHLSGGKVLHLGPGKEGQISDHDADRPGVAKMLEAKELELVGEGASLASSRGQGGAAHAETHGHHPASGTRQRGDR
jgi:hypothetical protein